MPILQASWHWHQCVWFGVGLQQKDVAMFMQTQQTEQLHPLMWLFKTDRDVFSPQCWIFWSICQIAWGDVKNKEAGSIVACILIFDLKTQREKKQYDLSEKRLKSQHESAVKTSHVCVSVLPQSVRFSMVQLKTTAAFTLQLKLSWIWFLCSDVTHIWFFFSQCEQH